MSNMLHSGRKKKRIQHRSTAKTLAFALYVGGSGGQSVAAAFDDKDNQQIISNALHNNNTTPALRSLAPLKQLVTTYESQSASAGMMFDIKTKNSIIIRGLDINTARRGYTQLEIYTKTGSHKMNGRPTMNENVWKLWMNDTIDAKGKDNPTRIPPSIFAPITVPEDQIRSFYVTFTDGPHLRYNNEGLTRFVSDDVIIFGQGSAKRIGWDGAILSPRTFSGGLYYEVVPNFGDDDDEEGVPIISVPTERPNTVRPTPRPRTKRPSKSPTPRPTPLPTPEIVPQMIVGSFRLRLYWEEGYRWQETSREMWYCMEVDEVKEGEKVEIEHCGTSTRQQWVQNGDTFSPQRDTSLCMTVTGVRSDNPIRLRSCDGRKEQRFIGLQSIEENKRFELQPSIYNGVHCVTQQHHPKSGEDIYPTYCSTARRHETAGWITY